MTTIIVPNESTNDLIGIGLALKRLGLLIELIYDPERDMFQVTLYNGGNHITSEHAASGISAKLPIAFQQALNTLPVGATAEGADSVGRMK